MKEKNNIKTVESLMNEHYIFSYKCPHCLKMNEGKYPNSVLGIPSSPITQCLYCEEEIKLKWVQE